MYFCSYILKPHYLSSTFLLRFCTSLFMIGILDICFKKYGICIKQNRRYFVTRNTNKKHFNGVVTDINRIWHVRHNWCIMLTYKILVAYIDVEGSLSTTRNILKNYNILIGIKYIHSHTFHSYFVNIFINQLYSLVYLILKWVPKI